MYDLLKDLHRQPSDSQSPRTAKTQPSDGVRPGPRPFSSHLHPSSSHRNAERPCIPSDGWSCLQAPAMLRLLSQPAVQMISAVAAADPKAALPRPLWALAEQQGVPGRGDLHPLELGPARPPLQLGAPAVPSHSRS